MGALTVNCRNIDPTIEAVLPNPKDTQPLRD